MGKNKKNKGGRPKIEFDAKDWKRIDKMCEIQCTAEEISDVIGCSVDTLDRRVKEIGGVSCAEYIKSKASFGKTSLRRSQWNMAKHNTAMAIFLGKNYLGQRDRNDDDDTGPREIKVTIGE
ncbi:hypothetical protein LCGC14_0452370 [marine sediment metagenome]|uniref:Uncharacterized protein n=1 Tax=marine sediment metagenome TaxID=412755 RepID=A0A0F9V4C9_9ZZZZ